MLMKFLAKLSNNPAYNITLKTKQKLTNKNLPSLNTVAFI